MVEGEFFIPEADINQILPDGRHILLVPAGERIRIEEAREKGYLKDDLTAGPTEHKSDAGPAVEERIEEARTPSTAKAVRLSRKTK
jgi:hypothetical protein